MDNNTSWDSATGSRAPPCAAFWLTDCANEITVASAAKTKRNFLVQTMNEYGRSAWPYGKSRIGWLFVTLAAQFEVRSRPRCVRTKNADCVPLPFKVVRFRPEKIARNSVERIQRRWELLSESLLFIVTMTEAVRSCSRYHLLPLVCRYSSYTTSESEWVKSKQMQCSCGDGNCLVLLLSIDKLNTCYRYALQRQWSF